MIYLISSLPRSGSSMAMRCLIAGGLQGAYDTHQEPLNAFFGDAGYQPNGNGFYALDTDFRTPTFCERYANRLVKVPYSELVHLPPNNYRLLFMWRDPHEILASMHRFMPGAWREETAVLFYDLVVPALLATLARRNDMTVQTLRYAEVVAEPQKNFASLGWPIDAAAAASMVEPGLYRFRLENQ